jgi:hypothetical protein
MDIEACPPYHRMSTVGTMRVFHCDHCGQLLFFENVNCLHCGRALAYVPEKHAVLSLDAHDAGRWTSPHAAGELRLCANYVKHNVCNWALPFEDAHELCCACRLTRTIPNLAKPGNLERWYRLEVAKRRLVYTLDQLGLPFPDREVDPMHGLAFDFLEDPDPGSGAPKVMTGHAGGVITVNVAETDDAERARRRVELNEPSRTLLGHFRHESGHYFWDQLISRQGLLTEFRARFGDERVDYDAALRQHYQSGAPPGWQHDHVTAYATMHPWEDWAETWAHYLHMVDTLETSAACGISIRPVRRDEPTLTDVPDPIADDHVPFERLIDGWGPITYVLNNLNRGLGNADAYPFVLSTAAIAKLAFVHEVVGRASDRCGQK